MRKGKKGNSKRIMLTKLAMKRKRGLKRQNNRNQGTKFDQGQMQTVNFYLACLDFDLNAIMLIKYLAKCLHHNRGSINYILGYFY